MIQHVWSVLCKSASIDIQTRAVSLLNVVETIVPSVTPTKEKPITVAMELLTVWVRENEGIPAKGKSRTLLMHEGNSIIDPIQLEIDLFNSLFHRNRLSIGGLPIMNTGRFEFRIEFKVQGEKDWRLAAEIPFFVTVKDKEAASPVSAPLPG